MNLGKTVLIIEDEKQLLHVLHDKLLREGFTVLEATDGEKGLALALEKHPDIILLDIVMPKIDGITMLKKLRLDEWGKTVPVIVLTNLSDNERLAESMQNNVFDYLIKTDWKLEDVIRKIKEKLHV